MYRKIDIGGVVKEQRSEMLSPEVMVVLCVTCPAEEQSTEIAAKMLSGSFPRDWTAYVGACRYPNSEEADFAQVAEWGTKLRQDVAELLFPDVKELDAVYRV